MYKKQRYVQNQCLQTMLEHKEITVFLAITLCFTSKQKRQKKRRGEGTKIHRVPILPESKKLHTLSMLLVFFRLLEQVFVWKQSV